MHARVPIAPEMTRPSPTPPSPPGGNLTTVRRSPQRLTFTELTARQTSCHGALAAVGLASRFIISLS